jgi:hypothetical protein
MSASHSKINANEFHSIVSNDKPKDYDSISPGGKPSTEYAISQFRDNTIPKLQRFNWAAQPGVVFLAVESMATFAD